ncbi:alanine racemase [Paraliomyxa miuraensis]|uniref:alanine racemase n=1 Tax=Paraliomyxa miuraensis TaxID=376150 RepID=UPI0022561A41|nr:alanine racemase [Paraliomyxa miuraensis]MCX4248073.1 alanine racemase [Paraliomyxa miuraensis]
MSDVINLGRARKRKRKEAEKRQADANALAHGRTKGEKARERQRRDQLEATLDGARRASAPEDARPEAASHERTPGVPPLHEPTITTDELRPTYLEVDLAQLEANYRAIQSHVGPQVKVMPILKANAYGHGLVAVGRMLDRLGAPMLGVAYLEEAMRLRQEGVRTSILVLGGIVGEQIPRFLEHDLVLTASSVDKLQAIEEHAAALGVRARVHLKIDTGMERIGVHWYSAQTLLQASLRCRHVAVEGIFTHFANADGADLAHARVQLERFAEVLSFYERRGLPTPMRHAANSGAIVQLPDSHFDMVRPGILFYGARPSLEVPAIVPVKGALRWITRVVYFKVVKEGQPVSYGSTWAPSAMTRVVTLPVGYGDGYARALSGRAHVLVRGIRRPVVGRICMDQLMVDLGPDGTAYNGDEVVLLGSAGEQSIGIEDLAEWGGTIPHEVLVAINTRVPRVHRPREP